ncbi:hypothetical protein N9D31_02940 [Oligoflexaceae bacterium]|nr:hypothetical protein [Oligoflexaceae bacterium]
MLFKLALALKISLFQLLSHRKFFVTFVLNLSIGLIGFVVVDAFKVAIDTQIKQKSKAVLGADLGISARRMLNEEEISKTAALLPKGTKSIQLIELYSMAYNGDKSRLVQIVALDKNYPLVPGIKLEKEGLVGKTQIDTLNKEGIWVSPELAVQLQSEIGRKLQVGEKSFKITGIVSEDPSASTSGFSLAPKIYMARSLLKNTGLLQHGSRLFHTALFLLPPDATVDKDVDEFASLLHKSTEAQDIRIKTHRTASRELNRALILLGENLSLVALIALFLAGIGAAYLFKSHIQSQIKDMAVLLSIGFSQNQLLAQSLFKILILGLTSTVLIVILSPLILPIVPYVMQSISTEQIHIGLEFRTIVFSFAVSVLTSTLLCLPTLRVLRNVKPALLLKDDPDTSSSSGWLSAMISYVPAAGFFWALACWQSNSYILGSAFAAAFIIASISLFAFASVLLRIGKKRLDTFKHPYKLSWLNLTQSPTSTAVTFLAISLCALLLNIIPHLQSTVGNELKYPDGKEPPSLFLFDIQEDQIDPLVEKTKDLNIKLENISPLVRARLETTNGESVERSEQNQKGTREKEWENRLRNRTYNLSYRPKTIDSETIVSGSEFTGSYSWDSGESAQISLEQRFAERLSLDIGDEMGFDIQGVTVKGKVQNIRKVKWTSFQPNFFVQFQPGVLDDAPKSFLAAVSKISFDKKMETQNKIVSIFPNISIVDVEQTLSRINNLMNSILGALNIITFLAVLAGIAVIFSIMDHNAQMRVPDINLYKILGVEISDLKKVTILELAILIVSASVTGLVASLAMTTFLTQFILEEWPVFDWTYSINATLAIILIGSVTGYFTVSRSLGRKPVI